ncbi:alpha/beta fold hydrolase [Paenarthrobacter aurescens]|uniref:alpha/beta fold hydrolase n=1 Tax=Paenarthrobacter aurescens TaxID=43663 RepID=UPI001143ABE9|nr:alpha/beta hydrolase [Paenarthrobacter aurescens]MDO6143885.1 alpha/beta hydrolase [Paenarthrobacter aurescens]MDO6147732.1 alpha/beta hydrolase [Paenarthrobacter aurescens]MDO6158976.1 alpha/beta hydrolase [Paenarthrobacter aurescens]MDO6162960.1 alpha/beta hydrolase [Paenarthrobacter aurescens]
MHKQRVVFVHGLGSFGAAAWPKQHGMALAYDALFLRRHGFDAVAEPTESNVAADVAIVINALADSGGGHVVAHEQGAISAMLAAIERPELVHSLTLVEPACLSLTAELPATASHRALMEPLFDARTQLNDADYQREYFRRAFSAETGGLDTAEARRSARRLRLQAPPWEAPLQIVPGVPTLVLTGGWEPLYEEIAGYLQETGALRRVAAGGHRPQDSVDGDQAIRSFIADVGRAMSVQAS